MRKNHSFLYILLAGVIFLTSCSGNSAATQTKGGSTQPGTATAYPAPGSGQPQASASLPTGYPAPAGGDMPAPVAAYPAPGIGLQVRSADGNIRMIAINSIIAIARVNVSVNGKSSDLRKLSDLLKTAGLTSPKSVTVVGSNGSLMLTAEQLAKAYLDVADDGTTQLMVDGIPAEKWIQGVTQVNVE